MPLSYLNNRSWSETTREERLFCAELFFQMKRNLSPFLTLISKGATDHYEVGFEVCFYRDVLKAYKKSAKANELPYKRTFDIVLMSENELVIVEAKANTGFDRIQLNYFEQDIDYIKRLFEIIQKPNPKIEIIAIHSNKYSPSAFTRNYFSKLITWKEIAGIYEEAKPIFLQANESYE